MPQGISAGRIATLEGFSRQKVDEVAVWSQQRAARAREERRFGRSLVAVTDPRMGHVDLDRDELVRLSSRFPKTRAPRASTTSTLATSASVRAPPGARPGRRFTGPNAA